ncbi:MAG: recombination protein RecR [Bacilli bacterium]|nr:recombination protein RecR [Bacilli bacterium]
MKFPKSLEELIECFKLLPGIGEKNAERLSFAVLQFSEENSNRFSESIKNVKTKIKKCKKCNNLTEDNDECDICRDDSRDSSVICVVENTKDLILFEKSNAFKGKYHVLEGLISPLEGINPSDIKINELINRIKDEKIKEVILALNLSMEGETTSLYILKLLEGMDVSVTKIAAGIPVGADMEYLDALTIQRALEGRNKLS